MIITTIFLLFILMIGTVSANNNTNPINSEITNNHILHNNDNKNTHQNDSNQDIKDIPLKEKNNQNKLKKEETPLNTENKNIYVNKSSDKIIEDGSEANPYKTINEELINKLPNSTTINIANGKYELETINLKNNITIIGQNKDETILYTNSENGLFNINMNSNLKLVNLTIRDYTSQVSAAINNNGILTLENSFFQNVSRDIKTAKGGFIYNTNILTVKDCIFDSAKASYGAFIYTNAGQTTLNNTKFTNSETLNVGGAIYSINSKTEIYDSQFMYNKAVSGAAVYNAFGNLTVNNSYFFKNNAQHFFGGAIYNTGRTIVNNSEFIENHATIDGGAITNTNYFYSINCTYNSNWAEKNGGAIENFPCNESERGDLIIINNTFSENSAVNYGGVIINYKQGTPVIMGTVTITNNNFIENIAYKGGIIYNEGTLTITNNTLTENIAEEGNFIYMCKTGNAKISQTNFKIEDIYFDSEDIKVEQINQDTLIIGDYNLNENYTENFSNQDTNKSSETANTVITYQNIPTKINKYDVTIYLTLKKIKKVSKTVKKLYLKVTVNYKNKKLINKNIIIKIKRKQVKIKKINNKHKQNKLNHVQSFKFTVQIKGKKYTSKTDKKGKIKFKINNLYNKGTYVTKLSYNNAKFYKNSKNIKFKI